MTGPEHYLLAEQYLVDNRRNQDVDHDTRMRYLLITQIHATLALAAATALATTGPDGRAWADAAGTKHGGQPGPEPGARH